MNTLNQTYFEWFDLPMAFPLDKEKLRHCYQEKQKIYHPDRFQDYAEAEKIQALQICATLNEAYRILQNSAELADYCLRLCAPSVIDKPLDAAVQNAFLMQQFELRETLETLKTADQLIAFEQKIKKLTHATEQELWQVLNNKDWLKVKQKRDELYYFIKLQQEIDLLLDDQLDF